MFRRILPASFLFACLSFAPVGRHVIAGEPPLYGFSLQSSQSERQWEEKLRAMIRVTFGPTVFKQEHLGIWLGFWSAIGKSATLKKLNRELYRQDRDTYQRVFEEIARKRGRAIDARRAAITLGALMDGLWLEWCLDPKGFSPNEAESACLEFVERSFS